MSDFILGTAGHIDHGKTTLIKALTNINTDRLKEEQERGITIELGFAFLKTPDNETIGIVDVPGHEKFIKNMVAGVYGINVVMLIIAADESVMPQTVEHIEICELLGIKKGIIVVTKTDLVDKELLELVLDDINSFKKNTFLKDAPVFPVSSKTFEGLDELKNYLFKLSSLNVDKPRNGYFVLPVDRVFTMKGFGTVVTGTTVSGDISLGEDVEILPNKLSGKVRTIQIHGKQVDSVRFGHRTAINIQGVGKNEIKRGDIVTLPRLFNVTNVLNAEIKYLNSNKKSLKNRLQVKFHSGTSSIPAKIVILDKNEINSGETAYIQIFLEKPVFGTLGDRYIIRSFDDKRTLGGGIILDATGDKKKRFKREDINYLDILANGSFKDRIEAITNRYGKLGMALSEMISFVNVKKEILLDIIKSLNIIIFDENNKLFITENNFQKLYDLILLNIEKYHKNNPKSQGMSLEEVRNKVDENLNFNLFQMVIDRLISDNKIILSNGIVCLKNFSIQLNSEDEKNKSIIFELIKSGEASPPFLAQIQKQTNMEEKELQSLLNILVNEDKIIKIKSDFYFYKPLFNAIKEKLINYLEKNKEISIRDFKKIINTSRKYLIPLLEYFDSKKITVRQGDKRVLKH